MFANITYHLLTDMSFRSHSRLFYIFWSYLHAVISQGRQAMEED